MANIGFSIWQYFRLLFQNRNDKRRGDILERRLQELYTIQQDLKSQISNYQPTQISLPHLQNNNRECNLSIVLFQPFKHTSQSISMESLWKKREAIELQKIKAIEDKITVLLNTAEQFAQKEDLQCADKLMNEIAGIITSISNKTICNEYSNLISKISNTREKIRLEKIRIEEERKAKEEQEKIRKQKEIEEQRIREQKEQEEKERQIKELEAKLAQEEEERREELERLTELSSHKSDEAEEIMQYLVDNNVDYFYHFTDKRNVEWIKRYGGLYSWAYTREKKMTIPKYGGDETSRDLDRRFGWQDYVRLSFCRDHPMGYIVEQRTGCRLALLKISINVASIAGVLFSNSNAASNGHIHGEGLEALQTVDIKATQRQYVSRENPAFAKHQAECMVKTFIPLEYIINIDNPDEI